VPGTTDPQCIAVPVTDDDVLEDVLQTFHVALTVVTVDDRVLLGQRNRAAINIQDNDSKNRHNHICIHLPIGLSDCLSMSLQSIYIVLLIHLSIYLFICINSIDLPSYLSILYILVTPSSPLSQLV